MFQDYDPLNCGRIAPQQFRRALDAMGLGAVLSQPEMVCVMRHYLDPNDQERICWRTFEDDCDQGQQTFIISGVVTFFWRTIIAESLIRLLISTIISTLSYTAERSVGFLTCCPSQPAPTIFENIVYNSISSDQHLS